MHLNRFMPSTFLIKYKKENLGRFSSVQFTLFSRMNVYSVLCLISLSIIFGEDRPYYILSDYYDFWVVVRKNSSGQLYFSPDLSSRRIFAWKPYNASIPPTFFFEEYPEIVQDNISSAASGNSEGTIPENILVNHESTVQEAEETVSSQYRSGFHPLDVSRTAALEVPPTNRN